MQKLREVLEQAQKNKVAVGHFNIGDDNILMGVFAAARELRVPVMVGVSEGERAFLGVRQVAALVKSLRDEFDFPIYLNADHTHSLAKALEAARTPASIPSSSIFPRCLSTKTCARPAKPCKN